MYEYSPLEVVTVKSGRKMEFICLQSCERSHVLTTAIGFGDALRNGDKRRRDRILVTEYIAEN